MPIGIIIRALIHLFRFGQGIDQVGKEISSRNAAGKALVDFLHTMPLDESERKVTLRFLQYEYAGKSQKRIIKLQRSHIGKMLQNDEKSKEEWLEWCRIVERIFNELPEEKLLLIRDCRLDETKKIESAKIVNQAVDEYARSLDLRYPIAKAHSVK